MLVMLFITEKSRLAWGRQKMEPKKAWIVPVLDTLEVDGTLSAPLNNCGENGFSGNGNGKPNDNNGIGGTCS